MFEKEYVVWKDLWQGEEECQGCGKKTSHHLYTIRCLTKIKGKTLWTRNDKYTSVCDVCQGVRLISADKYKKIHSRQMAKVEAGEFPDKIVKEDFTKDQIELPKQTIRHFLALFWAVLMTVGTINLMIVTKMKDVLVLPWVFGFLLLGWIPFFILDPGYREMKKKDKCYQQLKQKE